MRNLRLTIEYDGSRYCGWQVQNSHQSPVTSHQSIQETIEKTLKKILQEKVKLIASGRTDAGVHALAQVANFKTTKSIPLDRLQKSLNSILPQDISIHKIEEASLDFHSRFWAKAKTYRYLILNKNYPSALFRGRVYVYPYQLDMKLMQQEAKCLLGRHDFKSFCASGSGAKSTIRLIKRMSIKEVENNLISIEIEADGFLYNMVRNIVGTLLDVARGRFPKGSTKKILRAKDRRLAGPTAPAHGLYLVKVKY
jgi:tRNA pseudouridine38-40 synthase